MTDIGKGAAAHELNNVDLMPVMFLGTINTRELESLFVLPLRNALRDPRVEQESSADDATRRVKSR